MRIVSWNINSVRLRIDLVAQLAAELNPDVICLQETKCPDDAFPAKAVRALGYEHIAMFGQKGYHGVATLSRLPVTASSSRNFCAIGDCRHLATDIAMPGRKAPVRVHNYYVPAGGDIPDTALNPKFAHKLAFLDEMHTWFSAPDESLAGAGDAILLGDLNVAPLPEDVWSHKQLLKIVSHTPEETERLDAARDAFGWVDLVRRHNPVPEKLYSWWSYRARDWEGADKGRRLDHIWATPALAEGCTCAFIHKPARGWERPSDHAPVVADIA